MLMYSDDNAMMMMMTQNDDDAGAVMYIQFDHHSYRMSLYWITCLGKQVFNDEHFTRPDIGHTTIANQLEGFCYIIAL